MISFFLLRRQRKKKENDGTVKLFLFPVSPAFNRLTGYTRLLQTRAIEQIGEEGGKKIDQTEKGTAEKGKESQFESLFILIA